MKYMNLKLKTSTIDLNEFSGRLYSARLAMSGLRFGVLMVFALLPVMTTQAAVDVDQSPLIVSEPLPPNIVLIYDDSGSMGRTYLPDDAPRISGSNGRSASKNYQYYDPRVVYKVPPRADGSLYPTPAFPKGFEDPFEDPGDDENIVKQSHYGARKGSGRNRYYAFQYTDPVSNETHYVAENCSKFGGRCTTDIDAQQNVANWYSYYRKRDLSAKSGIFSTFADISPSFRVGFGSINNRGYSYIENNVNSYFSKDGTELAGVERFGKPSEVGTGVQREKFWGWMESVYSSGGTPLRESLKAAGEYYVTEDQPWQSGYDDGAKIYSKAKYSCRPSFTILLSDGYWNGDSPEVGNPDSSEPKPFYGENHWNSLADVALKYWQTDLRGDLENDVPVTSRDEANWQHMSTFTVGLGVEPDLRDNGGGSMADIFNWARTGDPGSIDTGAFDWGSDKIADLAHAAINGRGDFASARNPQEFANGLKQALAAIAATPGAGSSPSFSGGETLTSNTRQYSASYMTGSWSGKLKSAGYDKATDTFSVDPWDASSEFPAADKRNIWSVDNNGAVVEFKAGALSDDRLKALGDNLYPSDPKGKLSGTHIVNYLRGDQTYENSAVPPFSEALRKRDTLLGDIVTSTPVVIGDPKTDLYKHVLTETYFDGLSGAKAYKKFAKDKSGRTPTLYVAANDGMLHAFNADNGKEVFAYIPGAVVDGTGEASLARLANPEYGTYDSVDGSQPVPHQFYNDGKLTTQNVYINDAWKTILVGTTGRGTSRTVYALDITNPDDLADPAKAEEAILWERSAGDGKSNDEWIGMALGRPTISLIKGSGTDQGQWVAHMGNGPNSENNKAALLQFDLATGALNVYKAGTTVDNGLAAPYVVQTDDSDGLSEYAFAGDLQGNVWRFELSPSGGSVSAPLYVAKDGSGKRQPITADMYATKNEKTGAIWVFFGTGRFLTGSDITEANPQVQTWYGLRALAGASSLGEAKASHTRTNLQKREILAENEVDGGIFRVTSRGQFSDLTSDDEVGWYMDLISPEEGKEGERIVYQTQLIGGRLIVNTLIPKSNSACDTSPAGATLIVDPFSGGNPDEPVLDANGDDKTDNNDSVTINGEKYFFNGQRYGVGMAGVFSALRGEDGNARLFGLGLDSSQINMDTTIGATGGQRLNWHEIIN